MKSKVYKIVLSFLGIILLTILFKTGIVNAANLSIEVVSGDCNKLDIGDEAKIKIIPNKSYENISNIISVTSEDDSVASVESKGEYYIIKAKKAGDTVIKVAATYYTRTGVTAKETASLNVVVPSAIQKSSEEIEREKLEKFCYNNNVNDITTAADQLMYLRSVIYNDNKNNNNSLWTAFVSSTTPEKREEWYKNITYNIRNSTSETQTVENKLKAQIDIDSAQTKEEKETAQKKFDNASNNAAKAQEDAYRKIVAQLRKGESTPRDNVTFVDVLQNVDSYVPSDTVTGSDAQKITEKASFILTIITNVGIVLAILMSAILGIKYMLGSLEEKAEYKKDLLPYFIGSILLFGVCTIVKVLQTLGQSINNI